jgi:cytochrome o ubiquinol oxidase operon protein cyoD
MSEIDAAGLAGTEPDLAPGEEGRDGNGVAHGVRGYVIGLVLAAGLTAASFYVCFSGLIYGPAIPAALVALAVAQMGVHLVFFLHLTTGPDNTNNALALAFGVLIVTLVIGGSLWIMAHLDHNMLPMARVMDMQR